MPFAVADDRKKHLLLIGGIGGVLAVVAGIYLVASRPSVPDNPDAALADIQRAEAAGDAAKLAYAVGDADERRAAAAVGALARVGGPDARPAIQRAFVDDRRWQVRQQAVQWYPRVADRTDPQQVTPVRQAVATDKSREVVIAGLKALAELKAWDALDQVFAKMNDDDSTVRAVAARAAEDILFMPVTTRFRADDPPAKRRAAIQAFRNLANDPRFRGRYKAWLDEEKMKQDAKKTGQGK